MDFMASLDSMDPMDSMDSMASFHGFHEFTPNTTPTPRPKNLAFSLEVLASFAPRTESDTGTPWTPWLPWIPWIPWLPWLHSMVSMDSHQPRPQHLAPKTLAFSLEMLTSFSARNDSDTDTWPHKAFCSGSKGCWLLVAGCLMVDCCFSSPTGERFFLVTDSDFQKHFLAGCCLLDD